MVQAVRHTVPRRVGKRDGQFGDGQVVYVATG